MALWIQISAGSDEPIYNQIVAQISEAIAKGELAVGDRLPAVRKLAEELVVNPNTAARAYTILEQNGLVATKSGSGTFIADPKLHKGRAADINILTERLDAVIVRGLNLGLDAKDVKEMFEDRLDKFQEKKKREQKK